jgi:anhydro-N-acetylmuramic acid kinase
VATSLFAGLMSGTSLDGVDAVLAEWAEVEDTANPPADRPDADSRLRRPAPTAAPPRERSFVHLPMPAALREELLQLNREGAGELHRMALAGNALADLYAQAVRSLLAQAGVGPAQVRALGAHGQTVRHRPGEFDGTGYTTQLLNGALLAERTGIDVVCDFRSRDVAAGGQGAPLVPAFHAEVFGEPDGAAVLNIGGIANLTLLPASPGGGAEDSPVRGFDCGPGNVLMDLWCERVTGRRFDEDGRFAASGRVHEGLLRRCLADPFFERAPPKSTGRDLFDARWLDARLLAPGEASPPAPADVMATLAELTAAAATDALARHGHGLRRLRVCGGGAFNGHLMRRLAARAGAGVEVSSTAARGIPPDHVESLAFAWLARAFCARRAGNLPAVTGAAGPRVLGALYPR